MLSYTYTAVRKSDGLKIHNGTADRHEDETSLELSDAIRSELRLANPMATGLSDEQIELKMCLRM